MLFLNSHNKNVKLLILFCGYLLFIPYSSNAQTIDEAGLNKKIENIKGISTRNSQNEVEKLKNNDYKNIDSSIVINSKINKQIYGSALFENKNLNFLPQKNIPTPDDYELGIGDEININISGVQEFDEKTKIDNNGNIFFRNYGYINLLGLSFIEAKEKIKSLISKALYTYLKSNNSKLTITLENVKTINVSLLGAINSGNYNISSLSTLFHLLYLGGGPDSINSYRNIKLLRNNKVVREVDLYDFMLTGNKSNNINLRNGDIVLIPPYKGRVTLSGEIKRKGIYELKYDSSSLSDIIELSGGVTEKASNYNLEVSRIENDKNIIINLNSDSIHSFYVKTGDRVFVKSINDEFDNIVYISGPVKSPGKYELQKNRTVKKLIETSGGMLNGAFEYKALLTRKDKNLSSYTTMIDLSIDDENNLLKPLNRNDNLLIYAYQDFNDIKYVTINGEVRKPGTYQFYEGISLKNILLQSGGITDRGNKKQIEIVRKKKDIDKKSKDQNYNELIKINIDTNYLSNNSEEYFLEKNDIILVKFDPSLVENKTVYISGEILNPGFYTLLNNEERLADIVKRADGFTAFANIEGARVFRSETKDIDEVSINNEIKYLQKLYNIDSSYLKRDSLNKSSILYYKNIIIDFRKAIENPLSENNIILQNKDSIYIPGHISTIKIEGEVFNKGILAFIQGKSLRYYLNLVSGVTRNGDKKRIFVVKQNGAGEKTHSFFGLFKRYPKMTEGSIVYVPPKYDKTTLQNLSNSVSKTTNSIVSILAGLSSSLLTLYLIKKF